MERQPLEVDIREVVQVVREERELRRQPAELEGLRAALARGEAELDVEAEPMLVVGALPARSLHGYLGVRRYIGPDNEMGHTNMPTPKESPARIRQVVMSSKNSG